MLSSGVAAHLPTEQMTRLGWIYTAIPLTRTRAAQEGADLVALHPIRQTGDKLSISEADTILAAVERLREMNTSWKVVTPGALSLLEQNGVALSAEQKHRLLGDLRALYGDCVVAPPVAVQYDSNSQIDANMRRAMAPHNKE